MMKSFKQANMFTFKGNAQLVQKVTFEPLIDF